jgi:hypothetical protein
MNDFIKSVTTCGDGEFITFEEFILVILQTMEPQDYQKASQQEGWIQTCSKIWS